MDYSSTTCKVYALKTKNKARGMVDLKILDLEELSKLNVAGGDEFNKTKNIKS